jgi:hypothetical protein
MKMIANDRAFFYNRKSITPGEMFDIDISKAEKRRAAVMLMMDGRCFPADFPEQVEVMQGTETRIIPRLEAVRLVSHGLARPVDKKIFSQWTDPAELQPETVRRLVDEDAASEKPEGSWSTRWRERRR